MRESIRILITALALFATGSAFALNPGDGDGDTGASNAPVIFVHGYAGNNRQWSDMERNFRSNGYSSSELYTFGYSSTTRSNSNSAGSLRSFVNNVRSNHSQDPHIVAHSNGGLVARYYLVNLGGSSNTGRFVSLGSPHSGTTTAYACFSPACFDMRPGSSFLNQLAGRGCDRSIWSSVDAVINPTSSARCGTSIRGPSIGHIALMSDSRVGSLIRDQF